VKTVGQGYSPVNKGIGVIREIGEIRAIAIFIRLHRCPTPPISLKGQFLFPLFPKFTGDSFF
jgi:hypothetical protein